MLTARTGPLLWFGALVGLWTAASFIETIRDILRRAYGVKYCAPFWEYRLGSILLILGAVRAADARLRRQRRADARSHHVIVDWFPFAQGARRRRSASIGWCRRSTLFVTFYVPVLRADAGALPQARCRKWPGALLITAWWLATVEILPTVLGLLGGYNLTYGSLAGVMIALIFFFVVGLGVVIGAELNAALAESGATALKGEVYTGPYTDELEVEEPQPGEDVEPELETGGPQL